MSFKDQACRAIARKLRTWADELYRPEALFVTSFTFTFEQGLGIVVRQDGRGCPITFQGEDTYDLAHTEADHPLGASN